MPRWRRLRPWIYWTVLLVVLMGVHLRRCTRSEWLLLLMVIKVAWSIRQTRIAGSLTPCIHRHARRPSNWCFSRPRTFLIHGWGGCKTRVRSVERTSACSTLLIHSRLIWGEQRLMICWYPRQLNILRVEATLVRPLCEIAVVIGNPSDLGFTAIGICVVHGFRRLEMRCTVVEHVE